MDDQAEIKDWIGGEHLYVDPDYVDGSHPMDTDNVTWHHQWGDSYRNGPNNASAAS